MAASPIVSLPTGFGSYTANLGVKDTTEDFLVITAGTKVAAAGVFTQSRFVGPSVTLSRAHLASGTASTIVVVSKNANVANGPQGALDAEELCTLVADRLGQANDDILVASTGVIGRPYPMDKIRVGISAMPSQIEATDATAAARAMMTTDTCEKVAEARIGDTSARIVGIAKGVGMIEPNMATMIAVICTDAEVNSIDLDRIFRRVVDDSFNSVSVDSDTSTSDSAMMLASGAAGGVPLDAFEAGLRQVCIDLTKMIARDGEGAETLIEVTVDEARDNAQAKRVAKAIVNSPLVKTAVHGADPNWGRVAMAIGKCESDVDIDQDQVVIRFGSTEVYPRQVGEGQLAELSDYLRGTDVRIHVSLRTGQSTATVWGCDLTDGYIRINADYTT